jgi:vitamin-K-epoxide reductase (warfarin-sensitive)
VQPAVTPAREEGSAAASAKAVSSRNHRFLFVAVAVLAFAGMAVSAVSLDRHYAKSASTFCDLNEKFNCDIVNRSEYSSLMGIPVAAIGVAGYAALFALATVYRSRAETPLRLLIAAVAGLAFALYLTYIEAYVLSAWCILCLSSLGLIAAIAVLAVSVRVQVNRSAMGES